GVQDGFALYLHGFVVARDGAWTVVQQGMKPEARTARRYHWLSESVRSFVEEPHAAIEGEPQGAIVNLTDRRAAASRGAQVELAADPDGVVRQLRSIPHLQMPGHHELRPTDVFLRRVHATLAAAAEQGPRDFAELLLQPGLGARTVQALAAVAAVVHGAPCRSADRARFALAPGRGNDEISTRVLGERMTTGSKGASALAAAALLFACGRTVATDPGESGPIPGAGPPEGAAPPGANPAPRPANGTVYDALDVSRLDGPNAVTDADALDDAGAVAGRICDSPPLCATLAWDVFLWNGALHRFQVPQGTRASVAATAADRVAGTLLDAQGTSRGFITAGDDLVELETLGGNSFVNAMSASGIAVGSSLTPSGEGHAVAWKDGSLVDLGARTGSKAQSIALAIDDSGRVGVLACDQLEARSGCRAIVVTDTEALDLGPLPDALYPWSMSAQAQVVGFVP